MDSTTAFVGASEQARMLAASEVTSPDLVELYLERIARLDGQLNAFRTVRAEIGSRRGGRRPTSTRRGRATSASRCADRGQG